MKTKNLSIIAAIGNNGVIGKDNSLPWRLATDLQHFKQLTMGKPMIMGRKTWESLPGLLPGRRHIVVTRNPQYQAKGAEVVHSLEEALNMTRGEAEVMLVGGANLYSQAIPLANRMYLTQVDADVDGDAWFPAFKPQQWAELSHQVHLADENNQYDVTFLLLERNT